MSVAVTCFRRLKAPSFPVMPRGGASLGWVFGMSSLGLCVAVGCLPGSGKCDEYTQLPSKFPATEACTADGTAIVTRKATGCSDQHGVEYTDGDPRVCGAGTVCASPNSYGGVACFATCATDATCTTDQECIEGLCRPRGLADGSRCTSTAQCTVGHVCAPTHAGGDASADATPDTGADAANGSHDASTICQPP